jgi:hypothetical protein
VSPVPVTVTVQAETLCFPSLSAEAFTPMKITALMQPDEEVCMRIGMENTPISMVQSLLLFSLNPELYQLF